MAVTSAPATVSINGVVEATPRCAPLLLLLLFLVLAENDPVVPCLTGASTLPSFISRTRLTGNDVGLGSRVVSAVGKPEVQLTM